MGLQARLMSQALRKLTAIASRSRTLIVFINQVRQKIGVTFGNGEVTTGGNALKFYASVRLEIRRAGALADGDEVLGSKTRVKVVKNKLAPPFRSVDLEIIYGRGICPAADVMNLAEQFGLLSKSGSWFKVGKESVQGREKLRELLLGDEALMTDLTDQVCAKLWPEEAFLEAK
jgi:recombination protein RecA